MERDGLLSNSSGGRSRGVLPSEDAPRSRGSIGSRGGSIPKLTRQHQRGAYDAIWSEAEISPAISRDLVGKAERWKLLAGESMAWSSECQGGRDDSLQLPEGSPVLADNVDKHELAAYYVIDALAGRASSPCIHDQRSLLAYKIVRNKAWNQLLNVCTIIHLILPMVEVQRCLPCMGPQVLPIQTDPDSLSQGWRVTVVGGMWLECMLCLLYLYDLRQVSLSSRTHVHHERSDVSPSEDGGEDAKELPGRHYRAKLPPWQLARWVMVLLLAVGLMSNMMAHYIFRVTWHRWSRVTLPFLFISRRTYLKHFVGGMIRILPRMLPVVFLMSFVMFFYAFIGYVVFRDEPRDPSFLGDLDLFSELGSAALTFLRMFMSIPFMLDVEQLYGGRKGIDLLGLSYGVIMVIFFGALVPAVANRNFKRQSKESYCWVKEQRKLALTRAYVLLQQSDGSVRRDDWLQLMAFLRPDCDREDTSALFDSAKKADNQPGASPSISDDRNRLSKGGFFMLCALGRANFSKGKYERAALLAESTGPARLWTRARRHLRTALAWSIPGSSYPLVQQVLNVALLVQGYQIVREGDDPEDRPDWAYPLGRALIVYFTSLACLRMIAVGPVVYIMQWRHALGMALNLVGVAYYLGFWFEGEGWHSLYHILQACRLMMIWNVLHSLGATTSEVAKRLEFVFPAVLRASVVLFSVTYSYAVVGYALYCKTPLGIDPLGSLKDHSMMQRWAFYSDAISFGSLHQSFASMTDVIMLSNWPIFMDAASDVGNVYVARVFFYSFKGLTFYFVMPVMLGFIVQSYMEAQLPGLDAASKPQPTTLVTRIANVLGVAPTEDGARGSSKRIGRAASKNGGLLEREDSSGGYGFSTLGESAEKETNATAKGLSGNGGSRERSLDRDGGKSGDDGDDDDDEDDDDSSAPVLITSDARSLSEAFWGAEQAKESQGSTESSTLQGAVARLETENASLRALVDSMQMDLQMANARLYDEMQVYPQRDHSPSPRRGARRSVAADGSAPKFFMPDSSPLRKRVGSSNSVGGMEAIVETEDEGVSHV